MPTVDTLIARAKAAGPPPWTILALAAALERAELAEAAAAQARATVERLRKISPVMVRNVAGDPPPGYEPVLWSWRARP